MYKYLDAGLANVWLRNGYELVESTYGQLVSISRFAKLSDALGRAILQKPALLSAGEFLWLRRFAGLSQRRIGELLDRTEQLVSLVERGGQRIETLFDREFRRAVAEHKGLLNVIPPVVRLACYERQVAQAKYEGYFDNGSWSFSVSVGAVHDQFVSLASAYSALNESLSPDRPGLAEIGAQISMKATPSLPAGFLGWRGIVEELSEPSPVTAHKSAETYSIHVQ